MLKAPAAVQSRGFTFRVDMVFCQLCQDNTHKNHGGVAIVTLASSIACQECQQSQVALESLNPKPYTPNPKP